MKTLLKSLKITLAFCVFFCVLYPYPVGVRTGSGS